MFAYARTSRYPTRNMPRSKSYQGSVGGKFIAHGIRPSTFQRMPKPRVMSQPPAEVAPPTRRQNKQAEGLRKTEENNRRQAEASAARKAAKAETQKTVQSPKKMSPAAGIAQLAGYDYGWNGYPDWRDYAE